MASTFTEAGEYVAIAVTEDYFITHSGFHSQIYYFRPWDGTTPIQHKVIRNIHSSHQDNEWLKEGFTPDPTVWIGKADAAARGIAHMDWVTVFNDRGEHCCRAVVTDGIRNGTVCLENG